MMDRKPLPTLSDVAAAAGVSLATASRVLNGSKRKVAEKYRRRVIETAREIGYSTNFSAQAIARGTSRMAALLLSDIADPYFSSIASGVARATTREDLLVTMAVTERDGGRELELLNELRGLRPHFVILAGSRTVREPYREELIQHLAAFSESGTSVVLIGRNRLPFATVDLQNLQGAELLAQQLALQGHETFSILGGPKNLLVARDRVKGFLRGLSASGLRVPKERLRWCDFTRSGGYKAMKELMAETGSMPQLVFAVNDVMAIGALTALRDAGLDVPGLIAVAGFDDIPAAKDAYPALTTVAVDLEALGERAVQLALRGNAEALEVLPTQVVIRHSTFRSIPQTTVVS